MVAQLIGQKIKSLGDLWKALTQIKRCLQNSHKENVSTECF